MNAHRQFIQASKKKAFDIEHRNKLKYNIYQYEKSFKKGLLNYDNIKVAKEFISTTKGKAVENLSELLIRFENNIVSRGTHVVWAFDKNEALSEIDKILQKHQVKMVVKIKSMISEELDLNHFLEKKGVEPVETDLGEFIVQLEDEPPYHILTPAMHKSKEDVAKLFHYNFGTPLKETPEKLTVFTREKLREKYVNAGAGITGANFLVADIGAVGLTENEGNGIMSLAFPKVHIVIAGIEKVIATTYEIGKAWPVLAQFGTGQQLTVYNSLITGPRSGNEKDGPEHMYVILLDNKRSVLYQTKPQKKALECIRCGACLNACPIYKNIGGHAYKTPYTGPIGSVISPIYRGTNFDHLATACTLCGRCTEVCPVKIPLHELILHNRKMSKKYKWHFFLKIFRLIASEQNKLDMFNSWFKNIIFKLGIFSWGRHRMMPKFEKQTFSIYWKKRLKHN